MSVTTAVLGFPRIGARRELKTALEAYWSGAIGAEELKQRARQLRADAWARQAAAGIDHIPSNDFSLYDHVLDTTVLVGAVPAVYGWTGGEVGLDTYFAMARGTNGRSACGHSHGGDLPAMEMTKWFDTNYHYVVPEVGPEQVFTLSSTKPVDEYLEARALGLQTRPVLLGPVTWLKLAKSADPAFRPLSLLPRLLPVYAEVLRRLQAAGAEWVQMDEPCLALDLDETELGALRVAYDTLVSAAPELKLMLTSYFGGLGANGDTAFSLPVAGVHLDLVRDPSQMAYALAAPAGLVLSLGLIDGRNVWRADLSALLDRLEPLSATGRELILASSCSLLHTPLTLDPETDLDPEIRSWLAFAAQKLEELTTLAGALNLGRGAVEAALAASDAASAARSASGRRVDPAVRARTAAATPAMAQRGSGVERRRALQRQALPLPPLPTTTIGSFPQTAEVRKARSAYLRGDLPAADYETFLQKETAAAIAWQEEIGLDVLVHGEFERNDMVQYFAERLSGFVGTRQGWVQSYGSRCVRPAILYGDVARPEPMTLAWWSYSQSLTEKPVKGMLTGPITILQWCFVRDDLPRETVCRQIALALRDEVADLEAAGAKVIQVDEAALREGLPLRREAAQTYLDWAVECFRLAASGAADETQIHTHMCYSEFSDILPAIAAMDVDVISIETARSKMELLSVLTGGALAADLGPGVYDIHSPRAPSADEMADLLRAAAARFPAERLWVNPDCGLKTRGWAETTPALVNLVAAAAQVRAGLASGRAKETLEEA
jgi:5-methyltetrahydropteroyltriglutamate--homocysteine methyltransferase